MIRKQIYIGSQEARLLKEIARRERKSEAAIIREALARRLEEETARDKAWQQLEEFLLALPADGSCRPLTRDEVYEERLGRFQ
jgi:hypothetical protein